MTETWLITGANRGLGRALTEAALAAGHRVVATVRGDTSLEPSERLRVHRLDVRDRAGAFALLGEVGPVDVLVNNAGYGLVGAVEEVSEDEARAIIDTDLFGALWLTQAVLPGMRARGGGQVVQISSVGGAGAMPFFGLYNAAKWALEGFSEALAGEVRGSGIRVTIAELGAVDTHWATGSMRFATPLAAYDRLRREVLGTEEVPWPVDSDATGGGATPAEVAAVILAHVADRADGRLRLVVGDDAPAQLEAVLEARIEDYRRDPRLSSLG